MVVSYIFLTLQQNLSKGLVTLPLHNRLSINDVKGSALLLVKVYRNGESNNESAKYKLL